MKSYKEHEVLMEELETLKGEKIQVFSRKRIELLKELGIKDLSNYTIEQLPLDAVGEIVGSPEFTFKKDTPGYPDIASLIDEE